MEFAFDPHLIHFVLTTMFSFLIGLEIRAYRFAFHAKDTTHTIGSVRTYTFVGMLGYLFSVMDTNLYIAGMAGFTLLFALFYAHQLRDNKTSILLYLTAMVVYSFGPLTERFALWLPSLLFVLTIFVLNAKERLRGLSKHVNAQELETLGKMVLLSAVVLPLLPHSKISPLLPVSLFEIWTAVVIVSAISYGGYLAQNYFFRQKGYLLTGIIGGLYSSTATTVVLSRKAAELGPTPLLNASILAASAMMYLRLIVIAAIFNLPVAMKLLIPFGLLFLLTGVIALFYAWRPAAEGSAIDLPDTNPLELGTAFLFALLFMAMMALTQFVIERYGTEGLHLLSFVVGFTDIDPFVLSALTGTYSVEKGAIVSAVLIAAGSNNLLKAIYAVWFGGFSAGKSAMLWLSLLGMLTIGIAQFV